MVKQNQFHHIPDIKDILAVLIFKTILYCNPATKRKTLKNVLGVSRKEVEILRESNNG